MNKIRLTASLFALALLAGCATKAPRPAEAIRVGTYNIRLGTGDAKTPNAWPERRADLVALVKKMDLDVFGLQEVQPEQAAYLRAELPDYVFAGEHRGADRKSDEASPVAYRVARFEAEKAGTFWLSETPDVPGVKGWGAACPRVCSYVILRDRATGRRFCFANTHTDHVSEKAREQGMLLVIERMRRFGAGAPVVFTGDHNCSEREAPALAVAGVLDNALYITETPPKGGWRTWNGWRDREEEVPAAEAMKMKIAARNPERGAPFYERCGGPRIDYVYVTPGTRVLDYETVNDRRANGLYPSDHFPVTATVILPSNVQ